MTGYVVDRTCHVGLVDGYGYAFVPGSSHGVIIFDKGTACLLQQMMAGDFVKWDAGRLERLLEVGILRSSNVGPIKLQYAPKSKLRSFGVWLHMTNRCNLDCPYCYICKDGARMTQGVAAQFVDKMEESVDVHQLKLLAIRFAGGEPSLLRTECR